MLWNRLKNITSDDVVHLLTDRPYLQGVPYWTAAVVVGFVAIIYSTSFSYCIEVANWIYREHPYFLFVTSPVCFLLATWLVEKYAPAAGGPGVPSVISALAIDPERAPELVPYYLSFKVALVVAVSSLLCMLGAGSLGREGPMVHMGACLFYVVGKQFDRYWPAKEHRSWIMAGGAAGVAAAFNAPLAGVVFVLEELSQQHFHQFKTAVLTAAIIAGVVSQWISGKYLYLGFPKVGMVPFSSIPWALLVGVLCGLFAYPFKRLLKVKWREKVPNYFSTRLKFAFLTGIIMAALAIFVNPGSIGGGVATIEQLLFKNEPATLSLIASRFLGTLVSHLSGCAGGFLAPALALGGAIGSWLSTIADYSNHNLLVMVGMASFLSAIVGAPFTAWVIVMEMTDRHQAIFPLMVGSLVAHGTLQYLMDPKRRI